jgi:WD40 repeat protein
VYAVAVGALRGGTPVIVSGDSDLARCGCAGMAADHGTPLGEPLIGHDGKVTAVAVGTLRDGTPVILSGEDYDSTVRVWRLADGTPVGEPLTGHAHGVTAVAAGKLADGTPVIVSGDYDGMVRLRRLTDGTLLAHPLDLSESVTGIALHGSIIVTAAGRDIAVHQPAAP